MRQAILNSRKVGTFSAAQAECPLVRCRGLQLAGRGEVRVEADGDGWPEKTSVHCWYCAHPFETPPVPRPISYNAKLHTWRTKGSYCCWGCAAADCRNQQEAGHLNALHQAVYGRERTISSVPPKYLLKAFGGPMSIEDFRQNQQSFRVVPARLVTVEAVNIQCENKIKARDRSTVDFSNVSANNEVLKLKRNKPLAAGRGLIPMHAKVVR